MISGILAVFVSRYSQLRDAFLVPTSPEAHGLSFLAAVQSIGPRPHPKGSCPRALGRRLGPASGTSAHLAPGGAARYRARACSPSRCCLLPALSQLTSFVYRSQISQDPPLPRHCAVSMFLLSPVPKFQLDTSPGMSHRPIVFTKSKIRSITFPQIIPFLHPHLSSTASLVTHASQTAGGRGRHIHHAHYELVTSPLGANFPTVLRSFHFSFIHLVKKWLLSTNCMPGTN